MYALLYVHFQQVVVDMWLSRTPSKVGVSMNATEACLSCRRTVLPDHTCSSGYRAAVQPLLVWVFIFFTQAHKVISAALHRNNKGCGNVLTVGG